MWGSSGVPGGMIRTKRVRWAFMRRLGAVHRYRQRIGIGNVGRSSCGHTCSKQATVFGCTNGQVSGAMQRMHIWVGPWFSVGSHLLTKHIMNTRTVSGQRGYALPRWCYTPSARASRKVITHAYLCTGQTSRYVGTRLATLYTLLPTCWMGMHRAS